MSQSVIGALRVTLGLDSAQFTAGMKNAQTGLQRFAGIAKTGALAIGAAMVTAGTAVGLAMKSFIDDADEMSKMAQKIGVPIEELSRLRYAADLSDVSLEALGKSLKRLSAGMLDASQKATGPAASAFAMLGIQVEDADGKIRSSTAVIEDLAARFARMPDGVEKTALAMRIFGKSGADMIPLLNSGADGLREMYAEAETLGIVLDSETGRAAEEFNDNLTRLGRVKDGIVTKITAGMLPALLSLTGGLVATAKNSDMLRRIGVALGRVLQFMATAAVTTGGFFIALANDIGMAATVAAKWAARDFLGASTALVQGNARRQQTLEGILAINRAIWNPPSGATSFEVAAADVDLLDAGTNRARRSVERLTEAEREAKRAAEELAREGERTFDATRTPAEEYAAEVERLTRLLNAAAISQDTFNRAMEQAQKRFNETDPMAVYQRETAEWAAEQRANAKEDAARLAADQERDLYEATYDGIAGGVRAAADGNLGEYLAAQLRERLFDGLSRSLTDLFLGASGGKGGKGGKGGGLFSQVFSFLTSSLPGFKTGGSFRVGGSGGQDSQVMAFRATPGEMVDIRRPGQDAGGAMAVHIIPSPLFDVRVQQATAPVAQAAGVQAHEASRKTVPADLRQSQRFNRYGGI